MARAVQDQLLRVQLFRVGCSGQLFRPVVPGRRTRQSNRLTGRPTEQASQGGIPDPFPSGTCAG